MHHASTVEELASLGWELNAQQHRATHLAARYDDELDWFHQGFATPAAAISQRLQLHASTVREWIRVGHALRELPLIDAAFRANTVSYAKVRILTRWAEPDTEADLLTLAQSRSANRLTTSIARWLATEGETDAQRDQRLHEARSVTSYTDGDGMVIIRIALPPTVAKPLLAAVDELVDKIAHTPASDLRDDPPRTQGVSKNTESTTESGRNTSADASPTDPRSLDVTLRALRNRWLSGDDHTIPTMAEQRADAFTALFLDLKIDLTTEVVVHVRCDGCTFDDGTPLTERAVGRQLDHSLVRLLIHDAERRPVNASSRRRHPTTRQKRVVMEMHGHECIDCSRTDLIEFDHNPPFHRTRRTITSELEPRCSPCHRARHRVG